MRRPGWFGPHRTGWGAAPTSWQGWAITALLLVGELGMDRIPGMTPVDTLWSRILLFVAFLGVTALTYRSDRPE